MARYSIEPKTKTYVIGYGFLSSGRNLCNKHWKHFVDTATKTGLDTLKTATKKGAHKTAETAH